MSGVPVCWACRRLCSDRRLLGLPSPGPWPPEQPSIAPRLSGLARIPAGPRPLCRTLLDVGLWEAAHLQCSRCAPAGPPPEPDRLPTGCVRIPSPPLRPQSVMGELLEALQAAGVMPAPAGAAAAAAAAAAPAAAAASAGKAAAGAPAGGATPAAAGGEGPAVGPPAESYFGPEAEAPPADAPVVNCYTGMLQVGRWDAAVALEVSLQEQAARLRPPLASRPRAPGPPAPRARRQKRLAPCAPTRAHPPPRPARPARGAAA
jgi:hypothetical protein